MAPLFFQYNFYFINMWFLDGCVANLKLEHFSDTFLISSVFWRVVCTVLCLLKRLERRDKISWAILQIRAKSLKNWAKIICFYSGKGGTRNYLNHIHIYLYFLCLPIILLLVSLKQERERTMTLALCSKVTVPAVYFWKKDRKKEHKIYFLHFSTMMMKSCSIAWAGDATTTGQTNLWYFLGFKICSASLYLICSLATYKMKMWLIETLPKRFIVALTSASWPLFRGLDF